MANNNGQYQELFLSSTPTERTCGTNATYRKYLVMHNAFHSLGVRDMRQIFHHMRTFEGVNEDTFMPHYGMTTGEFSCFKTLTEQWRRETPAKANNTF